MSPASSTELALSLEKDFPLVSVTDKPRPPDGGTRHDFSSCGPYWWPDPDAPDGLPYVRRDGHVNPEVRGGAMDDARRVSDLARFLRRLADRAETAPERSAPFRERAALLLRTFFLAPETRMNPSLNFGQAIPGRCRGRGIGIIDTVPFVAMLDDIGRLERTGTVLPEEESKALREWFGAYLSWLLESPLGHDERAASNNHGTWIDVQLCAYALFAGHEDIAREVLAEVPRRRLDVQLAADGTFPLELERTRPFSYTVFNLKALLWLADCGRRFGIDLMGYRASSGATLRDAVERMRALVEKPDRWTRLELDTATGELRPVSPGEWERLAELLVMGVANLGSPNLRQ